MRKISRHVVLTLAAAMLALAASGPHPALAKGGSRRLATVTGLVRDHKGQPLAGAIIRFIREGADTVAKQTSTGGDGAFTARLLPGKYLLTAVAEGFNEVSFQSVQVNPSDELSYRFNLEPLGQGRTAPERRGDRNDPKWRLRSAQSRRTIFQMDGKEDATVAGAEATAEAQDATDADESQTAELSSRDGRASTHAVVETYTGFSDAADSRARAYVGTNFAVSTPATEKLDLIFAGQIATNGLARLEATGRLRAGDRHRIGLAFGGAQLPALLRKSERTEADALRQVSVRAVDEWVVRDGVVVVFGLDYSRMLGPQGADSLSPRLGFRFDADPRTRFSVAYAPGSAGGGAQSVANFESGPVVFRDADAQPVAFVDGRAVLERSHRLEFGVERVIDNSSRVEASAFFDTVDGRGVGLLSTPLNAFEGTRSGEQLLQVANQQGAARGVRVLYTRRVGRYLQTSAGYAFGRGQKLAPSADVATPGGLFRSGYFQTIGAQLDTSFDTGTRVRTVLRFSPRAAIFAIDPFAGRLAVFDPSLSILVTQDLPTFGLPVHAEAVVDARNLLDCLTLVEDGETLTSVNANRRTVRGGISVRF